MGEVLAGHGSSPPRVAAGSAGRGALVAGIVLAILARLPELVKLPLVDQANFMLGGRELWAGKLLYRDLFDVKPPLIYWVYAALGAGGAPSYATVVAADLAFTLLTLLLVHAALARWLEPEAHRDALLMFGLVGASAWFSTDLGVLQAETVANLLVALALWLSRDGRPSGWAIGVLALAAGLTKILPAVVAAGVALAATDRGHRAAMLGRTAAVCALGGAAVLAWLYATGALDGFREAMAYASFQRGIRVMAAHNALVVAPAWGMSAVFALAALALGPRQPAGAPTTGPARAWLVLTVWLALALAQLVLQGKFYAYHFLGLVAPLALLGGWGLRLALARSSAGLALRIWTICMLAQAWLVLDSHLDYNALALARLAGSLSAEKFDNVTEPTWEVTSLNLRGAAKALTERTAAGDAVYTFGIVPQLYLLTGRPLWGPYVFHYGLVSDTVASRGFGDLAARQRRFLAAFDAAPPKCVVVPDSQSPRPGVMQTSRELMTFPGLTERLNRDYDWSRVGALRLGFRRA